MKKWQIKKMFNEMVVIGLIILIGMTFVEKTTKQEDLVIMVVFEVAYAAAKIKSYMEKNKRSYKKGTKFYKKRFENKEKESE